ncbi:oligopeptidase A [Kushneria phosphatilytica]|uniref:oligopeptidase A n=1 Tax=Kushneria phosphatilytica TaxID=657387 RepID=A0A5C1A413_9GAMM|nr:oligopeptidase A [Kushneria phosphatilytica]QEL12898.1 oligopeptidase A [Kushneria phosphatilytica]
MNASSENPLLLSHRLPPFDTLRPDHIEPAIEQLLDENRKAIETLVQQGECSWTGLVQPLETLNDRLSQAWSPVSHLNSTMNSPELREAYQACLGKLSAYSTWLGQHEGLFRAFETLRKSDEFARLDDAQQRSIDNTLRDFRLAGVDLDPERKARFGEIQARLSELANSFANNVLDATQAWHLDVEAERLTGLPQSALDTLSANAEAKSIEGYRITLDFPSFFPVMTHASDRELRKTVYTAFVTRASEQGPNAGMHDNSEIMAEIVTLRQELARLVGFDTYADYSLATKMAESPQQVLDFLNDLAGRAVPQARQEFEALAAFARDELGLEQLEPWDIGYASERLREARYALSQEALRPWFPAPKVIEGLFKVTGQLFGISFRENLEAPRWHEDVRFYDILENGVPIAGFYLDLYAREGKRGGAWMDECRVRRRLDDDSIQLPVAYLTCNFTRPIGGKPALLTHDEVLTLFHEFGHGLHHMLTRQEVADISGINGVAWDAVELPSQFLENFCWEREGLDMITSHIETGEPLPDEELAKLQAARNFQSAMQMARQLEFSLFDLRLHHEHEAPAADDIQQLLDEVRQSVAVVPQAPFNRFQHGFSHIFAGGYAAGYYSYKWAEVLSADAYSAFEEAISPVDAAIGQRFREDILEQGGARDAAELFRRFRGRDPQIEPLLRHSGIAEATPAE